MLAFTRTGGAVAHGPTLMESVADNVMRVAYQRGVKLGDTLMRPQSTNLITYSKEISLTLPGRNAGEAVEVLAGILVRIPAYKIVPSTEEAAHYIAKGYTPTGSGSHVLSFYARQLDIRGWCISQRGASRCW